MSYQKTKLAIIFLTIILLGSFGLAKSSKAAPSITGVSGEFTNGSQITVSGLGFGTKLQVGPLISSYDSATAANNWLGGSVSPNWLVWNGMGLSATNSRANTYQSSRKAIYDASGEYNAIGISHHVPEDKIYISYWMYRDYPIWSGTVGSGNNQKWTRIYQDTSHNNNSASIMTSTMWGDDGNLSTAYFSPEHAPPCSGWTLAYVAPIYTTARGCSGMWCIYLGNAVPSLRTWEHWEYYIDYPTSIDGTDAAVTLWKDGATVARSTGIALGEAGNGNTARDVLIGQVSGGQTIPSPENLDQIYIDNTPAHVFISDQTAYSWPDYGQLAHNEIQVPTIWSGNSLTFTLNQGSFSNGSQVYLYVVDSDGGINANGYAITLGGSSESDTLSPQSPSGLSVQ